MQKLELVRRLITFSDVQKIIIFGSIAEKKITPDSDLDLLIIKKSSQSRYRDTVDFRKSLKGLGIPIDVLVIEELDFQQRIQETSNVYYWANKNGKIVYDTV